MSDYLTPKYIDCHIGQKAKFCRLIAGKTLEDVGKLVGVSFQQIQKYERGQNSISSSRLYSLAQALGVEVSYFFEQLNNQLNSNSLNDASEEIDNVVNSNDKELINLIKHYNSIKDVTVRKKAVDLVKSISG